MRRALLRLAWLSLGLWGPLAACSTLVSADFDGLEPAASGSAGNGAASGNAGASNGGKAAEGSGGKGEAGKAGAAAGPSNAGSDIGGSLTGGAGGSSAGEATAVGGEESGGAAGATGEPGNAGGGGEPAELAPPTLVVLNELKGLGDGDDFIELFNPGPDVADLGGCYVSDDSNNHVAFPTGATIAPSGYVLVRLQRDTSTGMVTTCFGFTPCYDGVLWGIAATGEDIFFFDSHDLLLDQLHFPSGLVDGQSFGRAPNGAENAVIIHRSPGLPNNAF